jgi:FkbM family methyltransferase
MAFMPLNCNGTALIFTKDSFPESSATTRSSLHYNHTRGCTPVYHLSVGQEDREEHILQQVAVLSFDFFFNQQRLDRRIAILKLDIEGAEILALNGIVRHLPHVDDIIMEFSIWFTTRCNNINRADALWQLERLEQQRFVAYKLYSFQFPRAK